MPRAACPACNTDVKYSRDADAGTEVTCPECDEVFVPPRLKARQKKYSVEDEDAYRAEAAIDDPDRERKTRRVAAAVHHARRQREREARGAARSFFGGPEIALLIFAGISAVALPIGYAVAKRYPTAGELGLVIFAYCGVLVMFGIKMIRARTRIGG